MAERTAKLARMGNPLVGLQRSCCEANFQVMPELKSGFLEVPYTRAGRSVRHIGRRNAIQITSWVPLKIQSSPKYKAREKFRSAA